MLLGKRNVSVTSPSVLVSPVWMLLLHFRGSELVGLSILSNRKPGRKL